MPLCLPNGHLNIDQLTLALAGLEVVIQDSSEVIGLKDVNIAATML